MGNVVSSCVRPLVYCFRRGFVRPDRIVRNRRQWALLNGGCGVLGFLLLLSGGWGIVKESVALQYSGFISGAILVTIGTACQFCVPFQNEGCGNRADKTWTVRFRRVLGLKNREVPDEHQVLWSLNENYKEPFVYDPLAPENCEFCRKRRRHPSAPAELESPRHRSSLSKNGKSSSLSNLPRRTQFRYIPLNRREGLELTAGDRPFPTETPDDSFESVTYLSLPLNVPALLRGHFPDCPKVVFHVDHYPTGVRYPQDTDERLLNDVPFEREGKSVIDIPTPTDENPQSWWMSVIMSAVRVPAYWRAEES